MLPNVPVDYTVENVCTVIIRRRFGRRLCEREGKVRKSRGEMAAREPPISRDYAIQIFELPECLIERHKLNGFGPSEGGEVSVARKFWRRRVDIRVAAPVLFEVVRLVS